MNKKVDYPDWIIHKGLAYKIGRFDKIFMWDDKEWITSDLHEKEIKKIRKDIALQRESFEELKELEKNTSPLYLCKVFALSPFY